MGEPNRKENPQNWREKYPGWETFEGKPNDPRFESTTDPYKDHRFDTHLNPAAVPPQRPGATFWVLAIFLGLVVGALVIAAMYFHFQRPSPRAPEAPRGQLQQPVADHAKLMPATLEIPKLVPSSATSDMAGAPRQPRPGVPTHVGIISLVPHHKD